MTGAFFSWREEGAGARGSRGRHGPVRLKPRGPTRQQEIPNSALPPGGKHCLISRANGGFLWAMPPPFSRIRVRRGGAWAGAAAPLLSGFPGAALASQDQPGALYRYDDGLKPRWSTPEGLDG